MMINCNDFKSSIRDNTKLWASIIGIIIAAVLGCALYITGHILQNHTLRIVGNFIILSDVIVTISILCGILLYKVCDWGRVHNVSYV